MDLAAVEVVPSAGSTAEVRSNGSGMALPATASRMSESMVAMAARLRPDTASPVVPGCDRSYVITSSAARSFSGPA